MGWINKENLKVKELNDLHPAGKLFEGVNYDSVKYFKDDDTDKLWEISLCSDGSFDKRVKQLEKAQKVSSLLKSFVL